MRALLSQRSRLLGCAAGKISALKDILGNEKPTPLALFYCGDGSTEDEETGDWRRHVKQIRRRPVFTRVEMLALHVAREPRGTRAVAHVVSPRHHRRARRDPLLGRSVSTCRRVAPHTYSRAAEIRNNSSSAVAAFCGNRKAKNSPSYYRFFGQVFTVAFRSGRMRAPIDSGRAQARRRIREARFERCGCRAITDARSRTV